MAAGDKSGGSNVAESYRKAGPWLDASWQLTGSVAVWTAIGYFADTKMGTKPWLLVAGSMLGLSLGFYLFLRRVLALNKKKPE